MELKENKDGYTLTSSVNYPNNKKLTKQIITLDSNINIKKVEVIDDNNNTNIIMVFDKIDLKPEFSDDYFNLNQIIEETKPEVGAEPPKETATIKDVVYPMYLPNNTYLVNQKTVTTDNGSRLILTFDGDNPFTLIEEPAVYSNEHTIVPTFGHIEQLADSIGILSDNSINWVSNGIEYYVISDVVSTSELLDIARSISVIPVAGLK